VIPNRWRAASASFHYALAPRVTRHRAAAEQQRYAALAVSPGAIVRVLRPVAASLALSAFMGGCVQPVRIDMDYNVTDQGTSAAVGTWRDQRLRFFHGADADAVDDERRTYMASALRWLEQQDVFACPGEKLYEVQRDEVWAVEFLERGERFTVFVGCCDGYYFYGRSEAFACTGRGDYLIIN
jgi:hypothetical protein